MEQPSAEVVRRVRQVIQEAAEAQIAGDLAAVAIRRVSELYPDGDGAYDCPAVVLTPTNPDAAGVVVEVQGDELWWISAGSGPGTELHADIKDDRYELLGTLVRAVVAGGYRHEPYIDDVPRLFRSPRRLRGTIETFDTDQGPFASRHVGREVPQQDRRYPPY